MLARTLFFTISVAAFGAPSWPVMFSYSPDSLPIIDVRLAPPRKQMPEVSAALGQLDSARSAFESEHMHKVEEAYNTSLNEAAEKLPAAIDQLMRNFEKPMALIAHSSVAHILHGAPATSFRESHGEPGGHELTVKINLLPAASPDAAFESKIKAIEGKRSRGEADIFRQAVSEMRALTQIVQNEAEAQITRHANNFLHTARYGLDASAHGVPSKTSSAGLLSASQPVLSSGLQLTTNVRVAASAEPFHTVSSLVEDLERRRDASEDLIRKRLLELELKLLQAENNLIADHLGGWIARILRTGM
jgi:hypothetical protein